MSLKPKKPAQPALILDELEKSTEAIQAAISAILELDTHSLEAAALLERLGTVTALQRQMITAFRRQYLGT